jgi:hypothetical protein
MESPEPVTIRTSSPEQLAAYKVLAKELASDCKLALFEGRTCAIGERLAVLTRGLGQIAVSSRERQVAAQGTWQQLLESLELTLQSQEKRQDARTLATASIVTSQEPWAAGTERAFESLTAHLRGACGVDFER